MSDITLTTMEARKEAAAERGEMFKLAKPDNDPLPTGRLRRVFCIIGADGSFEDIDPVTAHTIEAGWLPTVGRKDAA